MAKVTVLPGHNLEALADRAGSNRQELSLTEDQFEVEDVSQTALDAALVDYIADQAAIDADFADKVADEAKDKRKNEFDDKSDLTALIKEMVDQLNELRALHSLTPLVFGQVNSDIRNRID